MAAALDDQAEIVLAGEIDGRDDVAPGFGGYGIDARSRHPGVDPTDGLRPGRLIADIIRVLERCQFGLTFRAAQILGNRLAAAGL